MKLKEFSYTIPEHLIAQQPLRVRDKARLMVIDRNKKTIVHDSFSNIGRYLPDNSMLIVNDSKVIPARLLGHRQKTGAKVEVFLLKKLADGLSYETLMRPLKRVKQGDKICFNGNRSYALVTDKDKRIVSFSSKHAERKIKEKGRMPLPPYIKRSDTPIDREYYQTVYARKAGSVAAPTAGLHFTDALLKSLKRNGHDIEKVTLHVNYATFKPVEEKDVTQHKMHSEDYEITDKAYHNIRKAKTNQRKIVAVGTTSCRVLETLARTKKLKASTDLFIYPGFKFQMTDVLVTNFHLPHSTLLMLVYAFGSKSLIKKAYQEAIQKKYRFYSYGDAMIIK